MGTACKYLGADGECVRPPNKGDNLCDEHTREWMRSKEFREAAADPDVAFWAVLRATKELKKATAKYMNRWLKRVAEEAAS